MQSIIREYLEQTKVGRKQSYKNLALFPLLSTYSTGLDSGWGRAGWSKTEQGREHHYHDKREFLYGDSC